MIRVLGLALATALAVPGGVAAAPGDLDAFFGQGGTVLTSISPESDGAAALDIDGHGRIIVAGETGGAFEARERDFALVRYRTDGTLDPSFGGDGVVTTDFGGRGDAATDLFVRPDGRIVTVGPAVVGPRVGGWGRVDGVAIARYLEDGSLDPSFGSGGRQVVLRSYVFCGVRPSAAAPTADGGLVVVANGGCGGEGDAPMGVAVVRLTAGGQLDPTFAGGGVLYTYRAGCWVSDVAVQPDGRIVLGGAAGGSDYCENGPMLITRLRGDGSFDESFDGDGKAKIRFPRTRASRADAIVLESSGRILAAGSAERNPYRRSSRAAVALAAVNPNGALDPAFSTDGIRRSGFRQRADDYAHALALTATGDLVVGGVSARGTTRGRFFLARFDSSGVLDQAFGGDGRVHVPFGTPYAAVHDIALDQRGGTVAVGVAGTGVLGWKGSDFAVARLLAE